MDPKHPSDVICDCLDTLSEDLRDVTPFLLLFFTASIAGIAFIISKFLLEGTPTLNVLVKIVLTIELLLLLMAAGNAMGSYASARSILISILEKKREILLQPKLPEPTNVLTELKQEIAPLAERQLFYYRNSYVVLASAVLLAAFTVIVRIWTAA